MERMQLSILGSGSARPTPRRFQTSQLLDVRNKQFLIDCGEGTQIRMAEYGIRTARLSHIFISHLHGDHCFGLIGLISTLGMTGHVNDIFIHSHSDLERILRPQFDYFCADLPFKIVFEPFDPYKSSVLFDSKGVRVTSIPLKHRVPTAGFLFEEKTGERHLIKSMIEAYEIPIAARPHIKNGADFVLPDGRVVPNDRLTTPPTPPKRYAYISDTAYAEKIVPKIEGVDCLYHEATYLNERLDRSKKTLHSTAAQAATIAQKANVKQLIIGHFSAKHSDTIPFLDEARAIFPNTIAAHDGLQVEL